MGTKHDLLLDAVWAAAIRNEARRPTTTRTDNKEVVFSSWALCQTRGLVGIVGVRFPIYGGGTAQVDILAGGN